MKHPTNEELRVARKKGLELLEAGLHDAEIARRVGVHRSNVGDWRRKWEEKGAKGLKLVKRGKKSRLTQEQWETIIELLLKGPKENGYDTDLWTLKRITDLIYKTTGVKYHQAHVWELLQKMDWTCQKPQTRAKERNEEEIERWKKEEWPRIKRGPRSARPK